MLHATIWIGQLIAVALTVLLFAWREGSLSKDQITVWLAWILVVGLIICSGVVFWLARAASAGGDDFAGATQPPHTPLSTQAWLRLGGSIIAVGMLVLAVVGVVPYHVVLWIAFATALLPGLLVHGRIF